MNSGEFLGQRVRVRGWADFGYVIAGVGCSAQNPCCNNGQGILNLSATQARPLTAAQEIGIPDFSCNKDGCNAVCGPLDPSARAFELVGVLKQVTQSPLPIYLPSVALYDIDWQASSQLTGGGDLLDLQKTPINTGTFTITNVNN